MSNKTVFITGSSTGIGRSTALYFQQKGWNVSATMRTPSKETELTKLSNVICPQLDVTQSESIHSALKETLDRFGKIDVVVNNAGYGLTGPFEGATEDQIKKQFETNVFGLMRVTRSVLPILRSQKSGIIINISSIAGRMVFPFYSLYHGTKWAVEGFTESLRFELEPLGIFVKLVEPGSIQTDFQERSNDNSLSSSPEDYKELTDLTFKNMKEVNKTASLPLEVAKTIFNAATDKTQKLRYPVGKNAKLLLFMRRFVSDLLFAKVIKLIILRR